MPYPLALKRNPDEEDLLLEEMFGPFGPNSEGPTAPEPALFPLNKPSLATVKPYMAPPLSAAPPPPERSTPYRDQLSEAILNPPERPKPSWGRGLAAGLVGGLTGYLNSSPARAVHQDPRRTAEILQRIELGDYPEKLQDHQMKLKGLGELAGFENKDNSLESRYYETLLKQMGAQGRADTRADASITGKTIDAGSRVDVQGMKGTQAQDNIKLGAKLKTKARAGDFPDYMKAREIEDPEAEIDVRDAQGWRKSELQSELTNSREEIAEEARKQKWNIHSLDYKLAIRRLDNSDRRTNSYIRKLDELGKLDQNSIKATKDYHGELSKAENSFLDEMNKLDRTFQIGEGFDKKTPDKLVGESRSLYFGRREALEKQLLERKNRSSELYAKRIGSEPDDFTTDHEESLNYSRKAAGKTSEEKKPEAVPPEKGKSSKGLAPIRLSKITPEFLAKHRDRYKSVADVIREAQREGRQVIQ